MSVWTSGLLAGQDNALLNTHTHTLLACACNTLYPVPPPPWEDCCYILPWKHENQAPVVGSKSWLTPQCAPMCVLKMNAGQVACPLHTMLSWVCVFLPGRLEGCVNLNMPQCMSAGPLCVCACFRVDIFRSHFFVSVKLILSLWSFLFFCLSRLY